MQSQVVVTIKFGEQKEIHKLILQEFQLFYWWGN